MKRVLKFLYVSISWIIAAALLILALYFSFKTKDDVATMIAGLWSALATVVLGFIALNQSRQYKKLSDKANKDYQDLQVEIRNLTNSMADAIDTLKRIEKAKYYPNIEDNRYCILGMSKDKCKKIMEDDNYTIQLNYINVNEEDMKKELVDIIEKYNVFAFCLKNIGEKTIRNFNCHSLVFPSVTDADTVFIAHGSCDIKPGQLVLILIINIPDYLSLDGYHVEMKFQMENLIAEPYTCQSDIAFYVYDNEPNAIVEFRNSSEY